jgi:large subunit ribosomal protein L10
MSKFVKQLELDQLRRDFEGAEDVLVVNVIGMEAFESNKFRLELRKKGISLRVVKNNLAKRILGEKGLGGAGASLSGPSAVVWGGAGVVELAKEITDWAKKLKKLEIKGGCVAGESLDAKGVEDLSKMPSRVELLGRIVQLALSPASNLVSQFQSPGGMIASQLKTLAEKESAEPAAEAAPEAASA